MKIKAKINKVKYNVKKKSPDILTVSGGLLIVGGFVLACFATNKSSKIIEESKNDIDEIKSSDLSAEDITKAIRARKLKAAGKVVVTYLPSVALTAGGISCMVGSSAILKKRNAALSAAYSTIAKSYEEYRKRVAEKVGSDEEEKLYYNVKEEVAGYEEIVNEKGKKKKVPVKKATYDMSPYAQFFEEINRDGSKNNQWTNNRFYNLQFLRGVEQWANAVLCTRGYIFANEIYDRMGMPMTKRGQVIGKKFDKTRSDDRCQLRVNIVGENSDYIFEDNDPILVDFNFDANPILEDLCISEV